MGLEKESVEGAGYLRALLAAGTVTLDTRVKYRKSSKQLEKVSQAANILCSGALAGQMAPGT